MEGKTRTFQDWRPEMGPLSCHQEIDGCTDNDLPIKRGMFLRVGVLFLCVVFALKLFLIEYIYVHFLFMVS